MPAWSAALSSGQGADPACAHNIALLGAPSIPNPDLSSHTLMYCISAELGDNTQNEPGVFINGTLLFRITTYSSAVYRVQRTTGQFSS